MSTGVDMNLGVSRFTADKVQQEFMQSKKSTPAVSPARSDGPPTPRGRGRPPLQPQPEARATAADLQAISRNLDRVTGTKEKQKEAEDKKKKEAETKLITDTVRDRMKVQEYLKAFPMLGDIHINPNAGPLEVQAALTQIRMRMNMYGSDKMVTDVVIPKIFHGMELAAKYMPFLELELEGFAETMERPEARAALETELTEMRIEIQNMFATPWYTRGVVKLVSLMFAFSESQKLTLGSRRVDTDTSGTSSVAATFSEL